MIINHIISEVYLFLINRTNLKSDRYDKEILLIYDGTSAKSINHREWGWYTIISSLTTTSNHILYLTMIGMIDVKDIPFTPTQVDSIRVGGTSTTTHIPNPHTCTYITTYDTLMRVTELIRIHEHSRTHKGSQRPRTDEVKVDGPDTNLASSKEWYITILSTGNRHYWWQETQEGVLLLATETQEGILIGNGPRFSNQTTGSVTTKCCTSTHGVLSYWWPSLILTLNTTYLFPGLSEPIHQGTPRKYI